ncbi:hypothetical protein FGB62_369g00 [Gracilaria domingensis]|nr:hypothetical protein FGB62_369g00 [Gracilaria domingensis]
MRARLRCGRDPFREALARRTLKAPTRRPVQVVNGKEKCVVPMSAGKAVWMECVLGIGKKVYYAAEGYAEAVKVRGVMCGEHTEPLLCGGTEGNMLG